MPKNLPFFYARNFRLTLALPTTQKLDRLSACLPVRVHTQTGLPGCFFAVFHPKRVPAGRQAGKRYRRRPLPALPAGRQAAGQTGRRSKLWKSKLGSQSKSDIENQLLLDPDFDPDPDCDSSVTGDG